MLKKIQKWIQIVFIGLVCLGVFVLGRSRGWIPGFSHLDERRRSQVLKNYKNIQRERETIAAFYAQKDFIGMEKRIQELLTPPRSTKAMGDLSNLYRVLVDLGTGDPDRLKQMETTLSEWVRTSPAFHGAWIARGGFRVNQAWFVRGNKSAREVNPEAWGAFKDRLEEARGDLEKAAALNPYDPHPWPWRITAAMGLNEGPGAVERAFQKSEKSYPGLPWTWATKTVALAPKWGGTLEGLQAWVDTIRASTATHPQLEWALLEGWHELHHAYQRQRGGNFLGRPDVWSSIDAYYCRGLEEHPEDMWLLSLYTKMACDAENYPQAWEGFRRLGNRFFNNGWKDLKTYHDWRLYAGGDVAITLLQQGRNKESKEILLELLPLSPTAAWIPFHLARLAYLDQDFAAFFRYTLLNIQRLFF